jgi:hypothetical protein
VKRISILLVLLMAFVAACGSEQSTPAATDTPEPDPTAEATDTPEPTDDASSEPGASADTGFEGDLADVIPDELNGVARTEIPGMEAMIAGMLAQQNLDASEAQFAFASYGEGTDAVVLTAIAMPDVPDAQLEMLARMLGGAGTGADGETLTIDGKEVLKVTASAQPGSVYLYFGDGAVFTVYAENQGLAEQLIGELP